MEAMQSEAGRPRRVKRSHKERQRVGLSKSGKAGAISYCLHGRVIRPRYSTIPVRILLSNAYLPGYSRYERVLRLRFIEDMLI